MFPTKSALVVLAFLLHTGLLFSQDTTCVFPTFYQTRGDESISEFATAVLRSNDQHIFLAGRSGNQTFLQKLKPSGEVVWTRAFQVNPFEAVTPSELIEDSEGMIVGCGTQGPQGLSKGYVFRYNPNANVLMWAHSISSNNPTVGGIVEKSPGGNFILFQNALLGSGERDAELIELNRATGLLNPGLAKRFEYVSSDVFTKMIAVNEALYLTGWSGSLHSGTQVNGRRQLLMRVDPGTFEPIWAHLNHLDTLAPVSFFGRDLLADGDALISAYGGSPETSFNGSGQDTIFLQKTDLNGNIQWVRRYNLIAGVLKLLSVPDGYILYGQQNGNQHVVIKTDKEGVPLWARRITDGPADNTSANSFAPNLATAVADSLYFAGLSTTGNKDIFLWKMLADGSMTDTCGVLDTLEIQSSLVTNAFRTIAEFSTVFSTATSQTAAPPMQETSFVINDVCPACNIEEDPCPEGNDFVLNLIGLVCAEGKINLNYQVCDLDGGPVDPLNIAFYNGNPFTTAADRIYNFSFNPLSSDSCHQGTLLDLVPKLGAANVEDGDVLYALVNVPPFANTPIDPADYPEPDVLECAYGNNLAQFQIQLPEVAALNLGPDVEVCPGTGALLDAGAGYFKYQWSNGLTTQTITANFTGQFRVTVTDDCGNRQFDTVNVVVRTAPSIIENGSFCPGKSVTIRGFTFDQSGVFQRNLPGVNGDCDTVATFFIEELPYQTRNEIVKFCPGETVTINGVTYEDSGLAIDTLAGNVGCDTIVFYFLQQLPSPFRVRSVFYCPGDSVLVNGIYYSSNVEVFDTIPSLTSNGCDTLIRIQIQEAPQVVITENIQFCPGASVTINGQMYGLPGTVDVILPGNGTDCDSIQRYILSYLPEPTRADTIQFCQGASVTIDGVAYTQPGEVQSTIAGTGGDCDTIVTYTLLWLPTPTRSESIQFCQGASVTIDGVEYTQPGEVQSTVAGNGGGCDTLVTYTLSWLPTPTRSEGVQFCQGASVTIGGEVYTQPGQVQVTIAGTGGGCDTLVTYTLSWLPTPTRDEAIQFCQGASVTIDGVAYTQPGTVQSTVAGTGGGCDTLVTYTLSWLPTPTRDEDIVFCPGATVTIDGVVYSAPGTVQSTIAGTGGGCDTLVTYNLDWLPYQTGTDTVVFCPGQSVVINGNTYNQPGTVVDTLSSTAGDCDVILTYVLQFSDLPTRAETIEFCNGETITLGGQNYTQPGTVVLTHPGVNGACDTVVTYTLQLVVLEPSSLTVTCPFNVNVATPPGSGATAVNYPLPTAASDCACPGIEWTLTQGFPSGGLFPPGMTNVCYTGQDSCGSTASCCFKVIVREEAPCETKVSGCVKYDIMSITADAQQRYTYNIRVTNNCSNKLIYTAIQLPDGVVAASPANNSIYTSPEGLQYLVRNPNYTPFYSIRFRSGLDSIANGESATFSFTLPAQSRPTFFNITSRLAPQVFYPAHLNTFNCPIGVTPIDNREAPGTLLDAEGEAKTVLVFPNPTDGDLFADLSDWLGQQVDVRVLDSRGRLLVATQLPATLEPQRVALPGNLPSGMYFLEVIGEGGEKDVKRFVKE